MALRTISRLGCLYALLALVGLVATWTFNLQYLGSGGSLAPGPFFGSAFANALTSAITIDVYLSALVFSIWIHTQARDPAAPRPWPYVILCFVIGLAIAFPLYLAMRELRPSGRAAEAT